MGELPKTPGEVFWGTHDSYCGKRKLPKPEKQNPKYDAVEHTASIAPGCAKETVGKAKTILNNTANRKSNGDNRAANGMGPLFKNGNANCKSGWPHNGDEKTHNRKQVNAASSKAESSGKERDDCQACQKNAAHIPGLFNYKTGTKAGKSVKNIKH